jgi:hypothetical protein
MNSTRVLATSSPKAQAANPAQLSSSGIIAQAFKPAVDKQPVDLSSSGSSYLEQSLVTVKSILSPVENKTHSQFHLGAAAPKNSYHQVFEATEILDDEIKDYIFKSNLPITKKYSEYMSELEAVCAAYYKLIAPNHIANTWAVFDDAQQYVGVASEKIPGFKSTAAAPLTEEDLTPNFNDETTYHLLDQYDKKLKGLENEFHTLNRKIKKTDENELKSKARLTELQEHGTPHNIAELESLLSEFKKNVDTKSSLFTQSCMTEKHLLEFYKELYEGQNISKDDLKKYRKIKGLAYVLMLSYIFKEDDLHQNNFSTDGYRIDFDMSLWPLLYDFKDSNIYVYFARRPLPGSFDISKHDILAFPNIKTSKPSYWPTQKMNVASSNNVVAEAAANVVMKLVPNSSNLYSAETNARYRRLEKHPVFIYHKFAALLKFIVTDADHYRNIALLHMREDRLFEGKSVIERLTQSQAERIQHFKDLLVKLPEFAAFVKKNGDKIIAIILEEFSERNTYYTLAKTKAMTELAELTQQSEQFIEHNANLLSTINTLSSEIQELNDLIKSTMFTSQQELPNSAETNNLKIKQKFDERAMKCTMLKSNESKLKYMAVIISKTEARISSYANQIINPDEVKRTYEKIVTQLSTVKSPAAASASVDPAKTTVPKLPYFDLNGRSRSNSSSYGHVCDYRKLKEKVILKMREYVSPGLLSLGGWFRHNGDLAANIPKFAEELQPNTDDFNANLKATLQLKERLEKEKSSLQPGSMLTIINEILNDEAWNITKSARRLPLLMPASPSLAPFNSP